MTAPVYLPPPVRQGTKSLEETIFRRRSVRDFASEPISLSQLSQLLWAAQGITETSWRSRSVPSAGATYPLEILAACGRNCVEGLEEGVYSYQVDSHSLSRRYEQDVRVALARASLNQDFIYLAPVDIVICALYARTSARYGARGERYILIEVGHAGQNIYLQAEALGLGTVAIGAFDDDQVREALRLDKQYRPLYIMPVGKPR